MPEARESEASLLIAGAAVTDVITSGVCFCLECIEIDATRKPTVMNCLFILLPEPEQPKKPDH
jgi:hypothetical protein